MDAQEARGIQEGMALEKNPGQQAVMNRSWGLLEVSDSKGWRMTEPGSSLIPSLCFCFYRGW